MISVCIPTYNGGKYIFEQLKSILNQLSENDEVIISDDNSKDDTISVIEKFNDKRIKILFNKKVENSYKGYFKTLYNVNRNMQNALQHASGDYIFFSDQDDIWTSDKINTILPHFNNYDLIVHDCYIFKNKNIEINLDSYFNTQIRPNKSLIRTIFKSSFHGCCMAFNRKVLKEILPIPNLPIGHDTWSGINSIINNNKVYFEKKVLLFYRRHNLNVSASSQKSPNSLYFKIRYRLYLIQSVFIALKNKIIK